MGANYTQGYALIVGVGGAKDLPHTVTDAEGIADILGNPSRCAYPKEQVKLLTGRKAGRKVVLTGLDLLAKVPQDSTVFVYFSGHGEQIPRGKKTNYYLMTHGYDIDDLEHTAISGTEFADKLVNIKAERMLVLLDCCHAGGFSGAQVLPPGAKSSQKMSVKAVPMPAEARKMFSQKEGRVLIASSTESELSYAGEPYSAFTTALIAALCGEGAAKKDGYVRIVDLALYTREAVVKLTDDQQHPTMDFEKADNFVVAYYSGGEKKPKGLPAPLKETRVETQPGSGQFAAFDQNNWTVLGNVTNMRDQINVYGDTTNIRTGNIGFFQPGWKVNSVNQIQGDQVIQSKGTRKKRR
jgi:hypothetical protein